MEPLLVIVAPPPVVAVKVPFPLPMDKVVVNTIAELFNESLSVIEIAFPLAVLKTMAVSSLVVLALGTLLLGKSLMLKTFTVRLAALNVPPAPPYSTIYPAIALVLAAAKSFHFPALSPE